MARKGGVLLLINWDDPPSSLFALRLLRRPFGTTLWTRRAALCGMVAWSGLLKKLLLGIQCDAEILFFRVFIKNIGNL